jgi:hypothetical protein
MARCPTLAAVDLKDTGKSAATMDTFEPPKASVIAAVNDGAQSAQAGAIAFSLVGMYHWQRRSRRLTRICYCSAP